VVHAWYDWIVHTQSKSSASRKARPIRQSVTIPAHLAREVRRVAKERKLTMSRALVTLAEQGVEAEAAARATVAAAYDRFMTTDEPTKKNQAGRELIQAIFGRAAIAEDMFR
jgi:hypothetical protein